MKIRSHILGFPRIGVNRELKKAQELYWAKKISKEELFLAGKLIRKESWKIQKDKNLDFITVGDFSWYDHVLTTSLMLGNIPKRHKEKNSKKVNIDTLFNIARGKKKGKNLCIASEMTKWFNTNYHYIVPELKEKKKFYLGWNQLFEEVDEAISLGYKKIKPVLLGPMTYLWLGKTVENHFNKLDLLDSILVVYKSILLELRNRGIQWVQIDEPILSLDLPLNWKKKFVSTYKVLHGYTKNLLTAYFDNINQNMDVILQLPVEGFHIDLVSGKKNYSLIDKFSKKMLLSLGVINGRNIWKANLVSLYKKIKKILKNRKRIWIGTSCSLLHTPVDLERELFLAKRIKKFFSFSVQKCEELSLLKQSLKNAKTQSIQDYVQNINHKDSLIEKIQDQANQAIEKKIFERDNKRNTIFSRRYKVQQKELGIPIFPTTTIGSFPQTKKIRKKRLDFKKKKINKVEYENFIKNCIKNVILMQEELGLDVLVHGEYERSDMVEYFGELLEGFVFTSNGWVQSYGSRYVKPPIIIGDVFRKKPITIKWIKYAQSLTEKPVKGMLTGPVTILFWSFFREDVSKDVIAKQIALALREEVLDLERVGISVIQIDEPALREGLPLQKKNWEAYLSWAVRAFRLTVSNVKDVTQIHTHMCYSKFNDIMNAIIDLDADVISIESSRAIVDILEFFNKHSYPNAIGLGIYDIHSPIIPSIKLMKNILNSSVRYFPPKYLWINPDCGLKTRNLKDTKKSLFNMIKVAKKMREKRKSF